MTAPVCPQCSIEGCPNPVFVKKRGLCRAHYKKWQRYGDPTAGSSRPYGHGMKAADRFARLHEVVEGGCWRWTGCHDAAGYGRFRDGETVFAHRWAYEHFVGPIPEGLTIDHVYERGCRFHDCVNPAHLEPVTNSENSRRANDVRRRLKGAA